MARIISFFGEMFLASVVSVELGRCCPRPKPFHGREELPARGNLNHLPPQHPTVRQPHADVQTPFAESQHDLSALQQLAIEQQLPLPQQLPPRQHDGIAATDAAFVPMRAVGRLACRVDAEADGVDLAFLLALTLTDFAMLGLAQQETTVVLSCPSPPPAAKEGEAVSGTTATASVATRAASGADGAALLMLNRFMFFS